MHYAVPLLDSSGVYVESKSGTYTSCAPPGSGTPIPCGPPTRNTQVWTVRKLAFRNGALTEAWTFTSDWKPEAYGLAQWEPVFQPVLAGPFLYVPGLGGSVFQVARDSGALIARIAPFAPIDPAIFVAGGLVADAAGNVYYDAVRFDAQFPKQNDVQGAWLVRTGADGSVSRVSFADLVPDAPAALAQCEESFNSNLPWPPALDAASPSSLCGSQRPGLNVVPAIAPDGTIYTVSRAHFNDRYGYLVAVRPDLTPFWSVSLRGRLNDGCAVGLPPNGAPGGCRTGATTGIDPATNGPPAGRVSDLATSSPVVLPDGSVVYGALTTYNYFRGHLMRFSAAGSFLGAYDFGWDITPAVSLHDGTFSVLLKDNHYELGSYCGDPSFCPAETGRYDVVSLTPDLKVQWRFTASNTQSCKRQADGSIQCVSDHPDGFEWCVNQPAVDAEGVVYANSEDGFLYAVAPDGTLRSKIFLDLALGAAYTPVSIGANGLVYCQNNGHLFAVGDPSRSPAPAATSPLSRVVGFR